MTILTIDNYRNILQRQHQTGAALGLEVLTAQNMAELQALMDSSRAMDYVLLDYNIADFYGDGRMWQSDKNLVDKLKTAWPEAKILLNSSFTEAQLSNNVPKEMGCHGRMGHKVVEIESEEMLGKAVW